MPITTQQPTFSFPSSHAFFDAAARAAQAPGSVSAPVSGMVYRIGKRTMQYLVDTSATRKIDQIRLAELPGAVRGRFSRYIDALLRMFGLRAPATLTPTPAQRDAIFTAASMQRQRRDTELAQWKKRMAAPADALPEAGALPGAEALPEARALPEAKALPKAGTLPEQWVKDGHRDTVVAHFAPEVGRVMEAVKHLYGNYPAPQARDMATGLVDRIGQELDAWLAAVSPDVAEAIKHRLAISARVEKFGTVAASHPNDPKIRQLELDKVTRFPTPAQQCIQLSHDLDQEPERVHGLAPFNEVALGDMHGNCELLLHSLVQLGFLEIADPQAWSRLRGMLRKLQSEPMTAAGLARFRDTLHRAVTVDPGCRETRLTLLGDLLADRMHNDICMLAILDLLHQRGVDYQVILSNHDMGFIQYYLHNRSRSQDEPFEVKGIGLMQNPDQAASLERCDKLLNEHRGTRAFFREAAERAYFPHLNVCSTSLDGRTVFSHGFVNQTLFAELCRQAGADPAEPHAVQVARINAHLRDLLADDGSRYLAAVSDAELPSALYAAGWNIGPGDRRYQEDISVTYPNVARINDPRLPHPDVRQAVHGHTQNVGARVRGELLRTAEAADLLARIAQPDGMATLDDLNDYLRSPAAAEPPKQALNVISPMLVMLLVLAPRSLEPEARKDASLRFAHLRESLSDYSPAAMKDLPMPEVEARMKRFCEDFSRAWNANCNAGEPVAFQRDWATPLLVSLEQILALPAIPEQATPLAPVVQRLRETATEFASVAAAHVPDAGPSANDKVNAYIEALEQRFISLDSAEGMMPTERKFVRTVYVA